jgi:hypothetical protein
MSQGWTVVGLFVLGLLILFGACSGEATGDPQEMQIRTYMVPEGQSVQEFRDQLRLVLGTGDQKQGTVQAFPNGTLAVTAPASVHSGIANLIEQMAQRGPQRTEPVPASVTLTYWVVLGRPAPGGLEIASPVLRQNGGLRPVFEAIVDTQGGMEFDLLEQLQLKSLDNNIWADIRGRQVDVRQRLIKHPSGERLADIDFSISGSRGVAHTLESRVKLEPGRFVVLGQTAYESRRVDLTEHGGAGDGLMLYYVISSSVD